MGESLLDLPGIGPVNAEKLVAAGLGTPEKLRSVGAKAAFELVRDLVDRSVPAYADEP